MVRRPTLICRRSAVWPSAARINTQLPPVRSRNGPFGSHDGGRVSAESQATLRGGAGHERGGTVALEIEIDPELAVANLRRHSPHREIGRLAIDIDDRDLSGADAREIELIDIRDEFHAGIRRDFRQALTGRTILADFQIERRDLA